MTKKDYLLGFCILALIAENAWIISKQEMPSLPEGPSRPLSYMCVLTGEMDDTKKASRLITDALASMIRLRFDVASYADCKNIVLEYCREKREDGYIPKKLSFISSDPSNFRLTHRISIQSDCSLGHPL